MVRLRRQFQNLDAAYCPIRLGYNSGHDSREARSCRELSFAGTTGAFPGTDLPQSIGFIDFHVDDLTNSLRDAEENDLSRSAEGK